VDRLRKRCHGGIVRIRALKMLLQPGSLVTTFGGQEAFQTLGDIYFVT
jgi:hypothetical protein